MKNIDQRARSVDDRADGRSEIPADNAFLQVNHDQRGVGIKNSEAGIGLLRYKVAMGKKQDAVGSIFNKSRKQLECCLKLLLLLSRQLLRDGRGEPVLSRSPALLKHLQAFRRERHQGLTSVHGVRSTADQSGLFERRNDSAHGLRTHPFHSRQA